MQTISAVNIRQTLLPSNEPLPQSQEGPTDPVKPRLPLKKVFLFLLAAIVLCILSVMASKWYRYLSTHEDTDDAYVTSHLHQISTRVNGTVQEVLVDDNEHVKAGQLLFTLDPRDLQVKVEQCEADLKQARQQAEAANTSIEYAHTNAQGQNTNAQGSISGSTALISKAQGAVRESRSDIQAKKADLAAREAEVTRAGADYERYVTLEKQGAVTTSARDAARRDYLVAQENQKSASDAIAQAVARLDQANESVNTAKAQLVQSQAQIQLAKASVVQTHVIRDQFQTAQASVAKAQTNLDEAQLNLSYTKIVAPTAGRIGKKTLEKGQRIEPGQPLMIIVADNPWVVANFKETQLRKMHAGQKVEMTIDSFADHKFIGHVLSFSPGSGSSFAVLPSDNATGNFTKIVQRLPVKILLDKASTAGYEDRLAPGMSVVTSVELSDTK